MAATPTYSVAVVGTGPTGLLSALVFARLGFMTALIGPAPNLKATEHNARTAALFPAAIQLLKDLEIWSQCADGSAPLQAIRIVDDLEDAVIRAPEILFSADEIGEANFGFNVPNDVLVRALWHALQDEQQSEPNATFTYFETQGVTDLNISPEHIAIHCQEGQQITAKLVVGADGRNSICRKAANLKETTWSYPQAAITCSFEHSKPHLGVSTELHRQSGPCTTVPMPGQRSSLVWIEKPEIAAELMACDDQNFCQRLSERLHYHLGDVVQVSPRAKFPLSGLSVAKTGGDRIALVGEAAHVIPPIGAQGLNLGFWDIAQLAECVLAAGKKEPNFDPGYDAGHQDVLQNYARLRKPDINARIWGVDALNRTLLRGHGPAHILRGVGLQALKSFGPLRRQIIRQGLMPIGSMPKITFPKRSDQLIAL